MLVALETYLNTDHDKEWKLWESQIKLIGDAAETVSGVVTEVKVPAIANHIPTLHVSWDPKKVPLTAADVKEKLRSGNPSIEVAGGTGDHAISITTWMLIPGQEKIVAAQLKKVLSNG
jgi:L-seryl-tRNA(Ser) seleniumtransferase